MLWISCRDHQGLDLRGEDLHAPTRCRAMVTEVIATEQQSTGSLL
jgi:hypothetical protein